MLFGFALCKRRQYQDIAEEGLDRYWNGLRANLGSKFEANECKVVLCPSMKSKSFALFYYKCIKMYI